MRFKLFVFVSLLGMYGLLGVSFAAGEVLKNSFESLPRAEVFMRPASFEKPVLKSSEPNKSVIVEKEDSKGKISLVWIWLILGFLGGSFVLWGGKKKRFFLIQILILGASFGGFFSQAQAQSVEAYFDRPVPNDIYSNVDDSSFRHMVVQGGAVVQSSGQGLFKFQDPTAIQAVFTRSPNPEGFGTVTVDIPVIQFVFDDYRFRGQFEIPQNQAFDASRDRTFLFTLKMIVAGVVYEFPLVDDTNPTPNPATIIFDSINAERDPLGWGGEEALSILTYKDPISGAYDPLGPQIPHEGPVRITTHCVDRGVAGCFQNSVSWDIYGNFCDNALCNNDRRIEICDNVDNCRHLGAVVRYYDPLKPILKKESLSEGVTQPFTLKRRELGEEKRLFVEGTDDILAADEAYDFQLFWDDGSSRLTPHVIDANGVLKTISGNDPSECQGMPLCTTPQESIDGKCCALSVENNLYDDHPCERSSDFVYTNEGLCRAKNQPCKTINGELGAYQASGCEKVTCPSFLREAIPASGEDTNQCYSLQDPRWVVDTCATCKLPNGIVLENALCTEPPTAPLCTP